MIIYTDLYNRTKNYTLLKDTITQINHLYNVKITTKINPKSEIYWGDKLTDNHLEQMPNLKWIHLSKTGYGKFNFPKKIIVTNTPSSSNGVAEFAISGLLMLLRGLDQMTIDRKSFDINLDYIIPFNRVNVLVVGFGNIGKEITFKLTTLGFNVEIINRKNFHKLNNLVKNKNFIINTLPLNESTKDSFTNKIFGNMEKYSYFINIGRGETVDEDALYNVLKNKNIKGAFLDVLKNEPIDKNHRFRKLNNTFITPHIANAMKDSLNKQIETFECNLKKYLNKQQLNNIVYG
tara:strand:+ start:1017 stop:1889 length:873 start_codon:yes stop_codon:yes gene_type:complete